jgi:putative membrane protein (TIGR04086 family)
MANHYQPQQPPPPIGPRGFFTGVQIRPIVAGAIVDYVATYILSILYLIFFFMKEPFEGGGPSQEALERAVGEMLSSPEALVALAVIGAFCTALGGYVAGRMAKSDEIKHGALVGVVSLVLGALQMAGGGGGHPLPEWYGLFAYVVAIPAGALGGYFAQRGSDLRWGGGTFPSG